MAVHKSWVGGTPDRDFSHVGRHLYAMWSNLKLNLAGDWGRAPTAPLCNSLAASKTRVVGQRGCFSDHPGIRPSLASRSIAGVMLSQAGSASAESAGSRRSNSRRDVAHRKPAAPEAGTSEADEIDEALRPTHNPKALIAPHWESTGNTASLVDEALPEGMGMTPMP